MSYAIYILTDLDREPLNKYKIGSHKGNMSGLRSRYITSMPNLIIRYFIETNNAKIIEKEFKKLHIQERVFNNQENLSEWVIMALDEIFKSICSLICRSNLKLEGPTILLNLNSNFQISQQNKIDLQQSQLNEQNVKINLYKSQLIEQQVKINLQQSQITQQQSQINLQQFQLIEHQIKIDNENQIKINSQQINCFESQNQISIQQNQSSRLKIPAEERALNDIAKLKVLRDNNVRYRARAGECETAEESEKFTLEARISKRNQRAIRK